MSLIFLSHSSANNAEAVALRDWLIQQGWKDIFLDLDPERGLKAGERWQDALKQAAERCELVVFLVSPAWAASKWCLAEFLLAKTLNKRIFAAIVEPTSFEAMPVEMTAEWQVVDLTAGVRDQIFPVQLPLGDNTATVTFASDGLIRLRIGLKQAGLDPRYFEWPPAGKPDRSPYPGLKPLEAEDAGIFFGREAPTVLVLDRLRGLREAAPPRLLVIQGASGAGKSSFLRAGLIPRLRRDDAHFLPLPIIRPENAVISGATGLIQSIEAAFKAQGQPLNRAEITNVIQSGATQLMPLLARLSDKARGPALSGQAQPPAPSLVFSIDQGEELFLAEGADEAQIFLALLRDIALASKPNVIILFTIRSDSYEQLQMARALEGVRQETFSLPPMPRGAFQTIIEGPAQRLRTTARKLEIEPALTARLLADIEDGAGKDALPLLAFTLERLYKQYGADGDLRLDEYLKLGGIAGSIEAAVGDALKNADSDSTIPKDHAERLTLLRRALIPAMAIVDPETRTPRRRVARLSDIPHEAHGLVNCLVGARLLATDQLNENGRSETIVEPAHEALLRQWRVLNDWLKEDTAALLTLNSVQQAAREWEAHDKTNDWLTHSAGRLEDAEDLREREDFGRFLTPLEQAYLQACRVNEDERRNRELEAAKKLAEVLRRIAQRTRIGLIAATVLMIAAAVGAWFGFDRAKLAEQQTAEARKNESVSLWAFSAVELARGLPVDAVKFALAAWPRQGDDNRPRLSRTIDALSNALPQVRELRRLGHDRPVFAAAFSPDGATVLTTSQDNHARLWDARTGALRKTLGFDDESVDTDKIVHGSAAINFGSEGARIITTAIDGEGTVLRVRDINTGAVVQQFRGPDVVFFAAFSQDGARLLATSRDRAYIWDTQTGESVSNFPTNVRLLFAAFTPDKTRIIVGWSDKNVAQILDSRTGSLAMELQGHNGPVLTATFSKDGAHVVTGSADGTARMWDVKSGEALKEFIDHDDAVISVAFGLDDTRLVTASRDKRVNVWDATAPDRQACALQRDQKFAPQRLQGRTQSQSVVDVDYAKEQCRIGKAGRILARFVGHEELVFSASFNADGDSIVTASADNTARIWNGTTGTKFKKLTTDTSKSIAFSPDGARIVTDGDGLAPTILDAQTGAVVRTLARHDDTINSVAFSPDGNCVLTASSDGIVRILDASTGKVLKELKEHAGKVNSAAYSRDGAQIVTASDNGTARIWDTRTATVLHVLKGHRKAVNSAEFNIDANYVVTGSRDGTGRVWDAHTGGALIELKGHRDAVQTAEFVMEGKYILTASTDKSIRVWNTKNGAILLEKHLPDRREKLMLGVSQEIASVQSLRLAAHSASSVNDRIVVTSRDRPVEVLDARTGATLISLGGFRDAVISARISPDGKHAITSEIGAGTYLWDISDLDKRGAFDVACARLGNNFDLTELSKRYSLGELKPICGDHPPHPADLTEGVK